MKTIMISVILILFVVTVSSNKVVFADPSSFTCANCTHNEVLSKWIASQANKTMVPVLILFVHQLTPSELEHLNDINFTERFDLPSEVSLVKSFGGNITRTFAISNSIAANVPKDKIFDLQKDARVKSIDPDFIGSTSKSNYTSPLKQFKSGIKPEAIRCNEGLQLVFKARDNSPACVKLDTKIELLKRGWAKPGPNDFGYNPGRGPVTLEKQTPANYSRLGPDPFPPSTLNRLVFFIKSNSTAQIYVQYTSDFSNMGNETTGGQFYTGNPHGFIPLNSSDITISSSPDHVSMSLGTNTTVVYTISTKNISSGLYWVSLTQICGVMPIAIDMNDSQINPSDIPVYMQHCGAQFLNYKILGISGGTVEYKLSQELK